MAGYEEGTMSEAAYWKNVREFEEKINRSSKIGSAGGAFSGINRDLIEDGHSVLSTTKASNPKDLVGSDKLPLHLWPPVGTILGSLGLLDGMLKYGRTNWREAGVRFSIYYDAAKRHSDALFEGEDIDPDSGLPHEAHILACWVIIADAKATGQLIDDRQYKGGFFRGFVHTMTQHVKRLKEKHADRKPKHYTIGDNKPIPTGPIGSGGLGQVGSGGAYSQHGEQPTLTGAAAAGQGSMAGGRLETSQEGRSGSTSAAFERAAPVPRVR